ncbi:hypothetical protein [Nonomuraea sp. SBT364]|uniref:hypothetical protein n=1 Tax=Nonomuraea sp. SBT364 TaxID=1580530 RepID=UPI00066E21D2|nr:hypothetical protein [Nonomuraea sp. SBT364]
MAEDVQALLREAGAMPYGEARTVLAERALREAEALREHELIVRARLDLTQAYQYGGEPVKAFTVFSRNLADHDAEPGRWGHWETRELLWHFKWIVADMRRFPEIPLRRALDAIDDMERRYRQAGDLLHAVHAKRCFIAQHLGDEEGTREWLHRWRTTPRDNLSDCEACDTDSFAATLAHLGRDEDAIAAARPILEGQATCEVQPQGILTTLLLPYLRTGRHREAAQAHRRAYRLVQGNVAYLDDFGDHMEFCALTGNQARGLEILQRELPLLERPPSPSDARRFMACAALLLRRLEETGHGHLTVRRAGRDVPVPELRAAMEAGAREIAARFDARNGNDTSTRRLEATLAAAPLVDHLPLVAHHRPATAGSPHDHWRRGAAALPPDVDPSPGDGAASVSGEALSQVVSPETTSREAVTASAGAAGGPSAVEVAVGELAEAVAGFTVRGDRRRAALARVDLARAYLAAGRALDAAETAEEAAAMLSDGGRPDPAMPGDGDGDGDGERLDAVRRTLAAALRELGEGERELETLRLLRDPASLALLGDRLAARDEDRDAGRAYAEAGRLHRAAGDLPAAGRALAKAAKCVYYATSDLAPAVEAYAEAREALSAAGPEAARDLAELAYDEAIVLDWYDEQARAAELCHEAAGRFTALGDEDGVERARDLLASLSD